MRRLLVLGTLLACSPLHAQTPPPAPAPLAAASNEVDCEGGFVTAQAGVERGQSLASIRQWAEALTALREAHAGLLQVTGNCPAQQKPAGELEERVYKAIQQAETAFNHQTQCQPRLDEALDRDIRASSARRQARDPKEIEILYGDAENAWRGAIEHCQSPYREKAERSLNATIKVRAENAEQISSGPACDNAWKTATTISDHARDAWKAKHWDEAAMLHAKAQLAWERSTENCTGTRQQTAQKKMEQAQLDAHNAEFCGPQWDEASELAQQMKARAASAPVAEREILSIRTEVAWRDAIKLCRGAPQSLAKNNAEAIVRERGAPLPPNAMEKYGKPPASEARPIEAARAVSDEIATSKTAKVTTAPIVAPSAREVALPAAPLVSASPAIASPVATIAPPVRKSQAVEKLVVGDATYQGNFTINPDTGKVSGEGNVSWANGDRHSGQIVDGQRQGKGRFVWSNGQWYDGDWKNDAATGKGTIAFINGERYEGQLQNGIPHGQGSFTFASGDRYTGQFHQGIFNGHGSYFWKSGSAYVGDWLMGKKQGKGRLTMPDGSGWEGEFRNDEEFGPMQRIKFSEAQR